MTTVPKQRSARAMWGAVPPGHDAWVVGNEPFISSPRLVTRAAGLLAGFSFDPRASLQADVS